MNLADIPVPVRVRGTDLGPWMAKKPADPARLPPAFAEVEDKRAVILGQEKLICDLNWGFCAYHDLRVDPHERTNAADDHPDRAAALRQVLDEWLDQHVKFEPALARGKSNPNGGEVPKAIERGRLGDLSAAPGLLELVLATDARLPVRREAAQLLVSLPARREMAATLALAEKDADRDVADWAAVAAVRAGDSNVDRLHAILEDDARGRDVRIQAALALGRVKDPAGVPVLAEALDHCDNAVKLCRYIILQLGQLHDRRAVDELLKHLPEVQNRREMVDALGDIGDPRAVPALLDRLASDEYVTVRAQAARALAKIGRPDALPALRKAAASDTEEDVVDAAKEAMGTLKAGRAL